MDRRFYRWVILGGIAMLLPAHLRRRAATWFVNGTLANDELIRLGRASTSFRRRLPPIEVFTDDQLGAITVPVQLLLGERSALHDAASVAERARQHIPDLRIETIPDTGHALQVEQPDLVAARIGSFTNANRQTLPGGKGTASVFTGQEDQPFGHFLGGGNLSTHPTTTRFGADGDDKL